MGEMRWWEVKRAWNTLGFGLHMEERVTEVEGALAVERESVEGSKFNPSFGPGSDSDSA